MRLLLFLMLSATLCRAHPLRLGRFETDTAHATNFAEILHGHSPREHVKGTKVVMEAADKRKRQRGKEATLANFLQKARQSS